MQAVAARAGLVGEDQTRRFALESTDHLVDVRLPRSDGAHEARGLGLPPAAWATAMESLWTSRPTKRGVGCVMADLRLKLPAGGSSMRL